jgi:putative transposase
MRTARIKVRSEVGEAVYHCMSKTVNGERLFDGTARELLRRQFWQVAEFCGVRLLTYAILSNHFHVLVQVPQKATVADAELLRRYALLHPKPTRYQTARLEVIKAALAADPATDPEAAERAHAWRRRQLALMGDVSAFMKLLKQRFAIWFNKSHQRFGPVWCDRFKSVLVEAKPRLLETLAAYIDLNPVRAGLVCDPKDYRFCGYAEAVAGHRPARLGLQSIHGGDWAATQAAYRQTLFGTAAGPREHGAVITAAALTKVVQDRGRLPLSTVLRCRIRYFNDGAVLGGRAFVEQHLQAYRSRQHRRARTAPRPLPPIADWAGEDLATLRGLRRHAFG